MTEVQQKPETLEFEAEVQELLGLMIHSLYKEREIFLRELVSNASDALDKVRVEALTNEAIGTDELAIRIEKDPAARTLSIVDNGIGMSREELVSNLGTIASSGTRRFLDQLKEKGSTDLPDLIGQFGVGFYSCFMVADEVSVETRRAGEEQGWRWSSSGDGKYSIEAAELPAAFGHGTRVTLHLKPEEDPASGDLLGDWTVKSIVKKYSDFVEYPIRMDVERLEPVRDEKGEPIEGAEPLKVGATETLNSMKPLWSRDKESIEATEYAEFYKHLTHDWNEPLETIHFKAEGATEYTALLYVPAERPMDMFEGNRVNSRLALYVKRVFIMAECEELLPPWLRFVRGLVDSRDLPLNVSRETLQHERRMEKIRSRLVRKVLDALSAMLEDDRERYERFWAAFGIVLKEGISLSADEQDRIAKICLFESSKGEGLCTLDEYVARMPEGQSAIYTITGPDRKTVEGSPHLEACRSHGFEVLYMTDPVDEWVLAQLGEYEEKPLRSVEKGELDLAGDAEQEARKEKESEHEGLLGAMQGVLDERTRGVRFSSRLTDSPAVLVAEEGEMSANMERILRQVKRELPGTKRYLELNAGHPLIERLIALHAGDASSEKLTSFTELLYGQALLAEGSTLPDPAAFSKLVTELMVENG